MKINIFLILLLLVGIAAAETAEISLNRGWNLVSIPGEGGLTLGTCSIKPLATIYVPYLKTFLPVTSVSNTMDDFESFFASHSFWVYSYQDCALSFKIKDKTSYSEIWLDEGWTFVPVTEDMVGMKWSKLGVSCNLYTIYTWDRGWNEYGKYRKIRSDLIGKGFLVNSDSCKLG